MSKKRLLKLETVILSDDDDPVDPYHLKVTSEESDAPVNQKGKGPKKRLGPRRRAPGGRKKAEEPITDTVTKKDPIDSELKGFELSSQEIVSMSATEKEQMLQVLKVSTSDNVPSKKVHFTDAGTASGSDNQNDSTCSDEIPVVPTSSSKPANKQLIQVTEMEEEVVSPMEESFESAKSSLAKTMTETESAKESDSDIDVLPVVKGRGLKRDVKKKQTATRGRKPGFRRGVRHTSQNQQDTAQKTMLKYMKTEDHVMMEDGRETETNAHETTLVNSDDVVPEEEARPKRVQRKLMTKKTKKKLNEETEVQIEEETDTEPVKAAGSNNERHSRKLDTSTETEGKCDAALLEDTVSSGTNSSSVVNLDKIATRKIVEGKTAVVSVLPLSVQKRLDLKKSITSVRTINLVKVKSSSLEVVGNKKLDLKKIQLTAEEKHSAKDKSFGFSDASTDSGTVSQKVSVICEQLANTSKESIVLSGDSSVYGGDIDKESVVPGKLTMKDLPVEIPNELYTSDTQSECADEVVECTAPSRVKKTLQQDPLECDTNRDIFSSDEEADLNPEILSEGEASLEILVGGEEKSNSKEDSTQTLEDEDNEEGLRSPVFEQRNMSIQVSLSSTIHEDDDENTQSGAAELLNRKGISKELYIKKMKAEEESNNSIEDLFQSQPMNVDLDSTIEADDDSTQPTIVEETCSEKAPEGKTSSQATSNDQKLSQDLGSQPLSQELGQGDSQPMSEELGQVNQQKESETKKNDTEDKAQGKESSDIPLGRSLRKRKAEGEPAIRLVRRPLCSRLGDKGEASPPPSKRQGFELDLSSLVTDRPADSLEEKEVPESTEPVRILVNKVKARKRWYDPKPYYAPKGCSPEVLEQHFKRIKSYFDQYQVLMREAQSRAPAQMQWGSPIKAGPHMPNTIDYRPPEVTTSRRNVTTANWNIFEMIDGDERQQGSSKENVQMPRMARVNERYQLRGNTAVLGVKQPYIAIRPIQKPQVTVSVKPVTRTNAGNKPETISSSSFYAAETQDFEEDDEDFQAFPTLKRRKDGNKEETTGGNTNEAGTDDVNTIPETQTFDTDEEQQTNNTDDNQNYKQKHPQKDEENKPTDDDRSLSSYLSAGALKIKQSARVAARKAYDKITLKNQKMTFKDKEIFSDDATESDDNKAASIDQTRTTENSKEQNACKTTTKPEQSMNYYKTLLGTFQSPADAAEKPGMKVFINEGKKYYVQATNVKGQPVTKTSNIEGISVKKLPNTQGSRTNPQCQPQVTLMDQGQRLLRFRDDKGEPVLIQLADNTSPAEVIELLKTMNVQTKNISLIPTTSKLNTGHVLKQQQATVGHSGGKVQGQSRTGGQGEEAAAVYYGSQGESVHAEGSHKRKSEEDDLSANPKTRKRIKDQAEDGQFFIRGTEKSHPVKPVQVVPTKACPICGKLFPEHLIGDHAAACFDFQEDDSSTPADDAQQEKATQNIQPLQPSAGTRAPLRRQTQDVNVAPPIRLGRGGDNHQQDVEHLKQQWQQEDQQGIRRHQRQQRESQQQQQPDVHSSESGMNEMGDNRRVVVTTKESDEDYDIEDLTAEEEDDFEMQPAATTTRTRRGAGRGGTSGGGRRVVSGKGLGKGRGRGRGLRVTVASGETDGARQVNMGDGGRRGRGRNRREEYQPSDEEEEPAQPHNTSSVDCQYCIICNKAVPSDLYAAHVTECVNRQEQQSNLQTDLQAGMRAEVEVRGTRTRRQKANPEMVDFIVNDDIEIDENEDYYLIEDEGAPSHASGRHKQTHCDSLFVESPNTSDTGDVCKQNSINAPCSSYMVKQTAAEHAIPNCKSKIILSTESNRNCNVQTGILKDNSAETPTGESSTNCNTQLLSACDIENSTDAPPMELKRNYYSSNSESSSDSFVFHSSVDTTGNVVQSRMESDSEAAMTPNKAQLKDFLNDSENSSDSVTFPSNIVEKNKVNFNVTLSPKPFKGISEQSDEEIESKPQLRSSETEENGTEKGTKRKRKPSSKEKTNNKRVKKTGSGGKKTNRSK